MDVDGELAPGGWRRAVIGLGLGLTLGVVVRLVVGGEDGRPHEQPVGVTGP